VRLLRLALTDRLHDACTATATVYGMRALVVLVLMSGVAAATPKSDVVGFWSISQLAHAESEVSVYEFRTDGTAIHVASWHTGTDQTGPSIATVARDGTQRCGRVYCDRKPVCTLGGKWRVIAGGRVGIGSTCTDGKAREVVMKLGTLEVVTVGGESGWGHDGWGWSWKKCADRAACMKDLYDMGLPRRQQGPVKTP
jgi:hypothetical protein